MRGYEGSRRYDSNLKEMRAVHARRSLLDMFLAASWILSFRVIVGLSRVIKKLEGILVRAKR